jgi:enoyl-CoA hydratase
MVATQTFENLVIEQRQAVALIQLNRPKALNALNGELMRELGDALRQAEANADVRCIVITGNEKAFAAGADIRQMAEASAVDMHTQDPLACWDVLPTIQKPVVAAVSGFALGGGMELALMCDVIVASESAKFGQPEINIGVMPGAGATQRLARAVGKYRAMAMILTGEQLTAQQAHEAGLVHSVVPLEGYLEAALELANKIAEKPPIAVRFAKQAILKAEEMPLEAGLTFERQLFYSLFATEDQKEGMRAFLEKRTATFTGR